MNPVRGNQCTPVYVHGEPESRSSMCCSAHPCEASRPSYLPIPPKALKSEGEPGGSLRSRNTPSPLATATQLFSVLHCHKVSHLRREAGTANSKKALKVPAIDVDGADDGLYPLKTVRRVGMSNAVFLRWASVIPQAVGTQWICWLVHHAEIPIIACIHWPWTQQRIACMLSHCSDSPS